ncbi:MAG: DNA-binding protein [Desulfobacteraceae bacterium]|nr:DNA-binding protein [Desulfobacteraceae bacterium]
MKYSEVKQGRIFVIRLEDGEIVHEQIEKFARDHSVNTAVLIMIGTADKGSRLVVGPEKERAMPVVILQHILENVHEVAGTGTIFPDEQGNPIIHAHMSCGRETSTVTGCIRSGMKVWNVMEIILIELLESSAKRVLDSKAGLKFLEL